MAILFAPAAGSAVPGSGTGSDAAAPAIADGRFAGLLSLATAPAVMVPVAADGVAAPVAADVIVTGEMPALPQLPEGGATGAIAATKSGARLSAAPRASINAPGAGPLAPATLDQDRLHVGGPERADQLQAGDGGAAAASDPASFAPAAVAFVVLPIPAVAAVAGLPQPAGAGPDERISLMVRTGQGARVPLAHEAISASAPVAPQIETAASAPDLPPHNAFERAVAQGPRVPPAIPPLPGAWPSGTSVEERTRVFAPEFSTVSVAAGEPAKAVVHPADAAAPGITAATRSVPQPQSSRPLAVSEAGIVSEKPAVRVADATPPRGVSMAVPAAASPRVRQSRLAASPSADTQVAAAMPRVAGPVAPDGSGAAAGGKAAAPPLAATASRISVDSDRLGPVDVAIDGAGDDVRVTLGLGAAALVQVSADAPRLSAELAAQGHRLQSLQFDLGSGAGGRQDRSPAPPSPAPVRALLTGESSIPPAVSADRYA